MQGEEGVRVRDGDGEAVGVAALQTSLAALGGLTSLLVSAGWPLELQTKVKRRFAKVSMVSYS